VAVNAAFRCFTRSDLVDLNCWFLADIEHARKAAVTDRPARHHDFRLVFIPAQGGPHDIGLWLALFAMIEPGNRTGIDLGAAPGPISALDVSVPSVAARGNRTGVSHYRRTSAGSKAMPRGKLPRRREQSYTLRETVGPRSTDRGRRCAGRVS